MAHLKKNIVWLASYPKSGNTWFRVFLSNLMSDSNEPVSINELYATPIASSRSLFDDYAGVSASDLSMEEIDDLRPQVYKDISAKAEDLVFHKVHDAWKRNSIGEPVFPSETTKAVIYFIRDPRDVAVSFAHHSSTSFEKIVKNMGDPNFSFCDSNKKIYNQLRQGLSSWSGHVKSWVEESGLPVFVLRYEDILKNGLDEFKRAVNYLELTYSEEKLKFAFKNSEFDSLRRIEDEQGFNEKPIKMKSFFREGKSGSWHNHLDQKLVEQLVRDHGQIMEQFGYLA